MKLGTIVAAAAATLLLTAVPDAADAQRTGTPLGPPRTPGKDGDATRAAEMLTQRSAERRAHLARRWLTLLPGAGEEYRAVSQQTDDRR